MEVSETDKRQLQHFERMARGMDLRRRELLHEAQVRTEAQLYEYRMAVLAEFEKVSSKFSMAQIARTTGMARSTLYRWNERLQQERIIAQAASMGVSVERPGLAGGGGAFMTTPAAGGIEAVPEVDLDQSYEDAGWMNPKRIVTGEVGATSRDGEVWLFGADGHGWNKSTNVEVESRDAWPNGAADLFDRITAESNE